MPPAADAPDPPGGIRFKHVRVTVLLLVLLSVLLYAWRDHARRRARTQWHRTLQVALILVEHEPINESVLQRLRRREAVLEDRLEAEAARYLTSDLDAFDLHLFGPVLVDPPAPLDVGSGWMEQLRHAMNLWRYVWAADEASSIDADAYDSRIYLSATQARGEKRFLEGVGQQGGRVGVVRVELEKDMVDFALIVAAHELFHTLGATDRYDESGETRIPEGLAEPDKVPLFPQRYVEIMARNRPVSADHHVVPKDIAELRVGRLTAREIGWLP